MLKSIGKKLLHTLGTLQTLKIRDQNYITQEKELNLLEAVNGS